MSVSRPTSEGAPRPGACAGRIAQSESACLHGRNIRV